MSEDRQEAQARRQAALDRAESTRRPDPARAAPEPADATQGRTERPGIDRRELVMDSTQILGRVGGALERGLSPNDSRRAGVIVTAEAYKLQRIATTVDAAPAPPPTRPPVDEPEPDLPPDPAPDIIDPPPPSGPPPVPPPPSAQASTAC